MGRKEKRMRCEGERREGNGRKKMERKARQQPPLFCSAVK